MIQLFHYVCLIVHSIPLRFCRCGHKFSHVGASSRLLFGPVYNSKWAAKSLNDYLNIPFWSERKQMAPRHFQLLALHYKWCIWKKDIEHNNYARYEERNSVETYVPISSRMS